AAGDRAFLVNAYPAAAAYFGDALALWPEDDEERPRLLFKHAHALVVAADALLAQVSWYRGEHSEVFEHLRAAEELVKSAEPSIGVARVLAVSARYRSLGGERKEGVQLARDALAIADNLS